MVAGIRRKRYCEKLHRFQAEADCLKLSPGGADYFGGSGLHSTHSKCLQLGIADQSIQFAEDRLYLIMMITL